MFKQRPLKFYDYSILLIIVTISVILNYFLWTFQSGICSVENSFSCTIIENFKWIQYLAYITIALAIIDGQYLYYIHIRPVKETEKTYHVETSETSEEKILILAPVAIPDFSTRATYKEFEHVENGFYVEVDQYNHTSNRVVEVTQNELPNFKTNGDYYIHISPSERKLFILAANLCIYQRFTPGSFKQEGFYLEVDTNCKSTEYYIYNTHKLPPTHAKGYRWIQVSGRDIIDPNQLKTNDVYIQESMSLKNFKLRNQLAPESTTNNGYYLEISKDWKTSNRVVLVENLLLPKAINDKNVFVRITEDEMHLLSLKMVNFDKFTKFTPGSYREEGYYLEVDLENKSTDYYIYTQRRLPPTHIKGYRWVKVQERQIHSK